MQSSDLEQNLLKIWDLFCCNLKFSRGLCHCYTTTTHLLIHGVEKGHVRSWTSKWLNFFTLPQPFPLAWWRSQYNCFILEIKNQCFMDKRMRNAHSTMVSNSQALPFHKPTAFPQWVFPGSWRVTLSIWNQSVNSWQLPETPHSISCSLPLPSFPLACFTLQNCRPQQLNVRGSDTVRLQNTTQEHLWPSKIFTS